MNLRFLQASPHKMKHLTTNSLLSLYLGMAEYRCYDGQFSQQNIFYSC